MQIPHDLVTVIREPAARVLLAPATEALLWEGGGGRRSFSQETCLLLVQERTAPDHEELVVPKSLWIMGLFVLPFRKQKGLFCLRKTPFQSLVQGYANCSVRTKRKGIYDRRRHGRNIMTTEPKFIPETAVPLQLEGGGACRVRLIDDS